MAAESEESLNEKKSAGENAKVLLDIDEEEPILDFQKYVHAISSIIRNSKPNFTVGIYGEWGTGKTTLMKGIQDKIESGSDKKNAKIVPVWFNAWRYEREEHQATIPMMKTIAYALEEHQEFKELSKKILSGLKIAGKELFRLAVSKVFSTEFNIENLKEKMDEANLKLSFFDKDTIYYDGLEEIKKEIQRIQTEVDDQYRIVVFVDDLDRCSPKKTLEVFESIKAFLDITGFIFVIGLSFKTTSDLVTNYYGNLVKGRDYIKKIIQVPIFVQEWNREDVGKLIKKLSSGLSKPYDEIFSNFDNIKILEIALEKNPREIKRFINTYIISNEIYSDNTNNRTLLQVQCLKWRWDDIYNTFSKDYEFRQAILFISKQGNEKQEILDLIIKKDEKLDSEKNTAFLIDDNNSISDENVTELTQEELKKSKIEKQDETKNKQDFTNTIADGSSDSLQKLSELKKYLNNENIHELKSSLSKISNDLEFWDFISKAKLLFQIKTKEWEQYRRASIATDEKGHEELVSSSTYSKPKNSELITILQSGKIEKFNEIKEKHPLVVDLSSSNLAGISIMGIDLQKANLQNTILMDADLEGANLRGADLELANLQNTILTDADLEGANLRGTSLRNANLVRVNFIDANLRGADLEGANLRGADLEGANLERTNLSKVLNSPITAEEAKQRGALI